MVALHRALGVNRLGGQDELHGDADSADVDEPDDAAIALVETPPCLEGAEHRAVGDDPEIARERQLEAGRG